MDNETTKKRNRRRRNKNKLNMDNCSETSSQNVPSNESFIPPSPSTSQLEAAAPPQVFLTKVYQVRSGTISQGWEYEYKLAALLALRCVRYGIKDWWFASNPEGVGDFDDLVVHLKRPNGKTTTFLIQLKHKDDPKNITQKDFLTSKGDFHLSKYLKTIVELHQSMCSKSTNFEIVKDLGALSDINFIFFTNRKTDYSEFLENHSDASLSFLNTKTKAEMHRINFTKLSLGDPIPEIVANCNLFMLSNQIHIDQTDTAIETEISKLTDTLKLFNVNIQDVAKGFSIHIRDWARGKLGGHYYFTKENVLCKLTELLLNQYTLNLIEKPIKKCINDKMHIWNQVTANQVITVVDYSETVVNFLIEYIYAEVQKYYEGSMQHWGEKLSEKQQQSFYKTYPDLTENLLKNVGNQRNLRPLDIYKSLWRINKLPLILISNPENNRTIDGILKLSNQSYKVIVVQENVTISHKIEETSEREQKEKEEFTKSFRSLKDLDKEERNKILEQKIKLQERPGAILEDIVNEEMLQYITSKDILDILLGDFNIGNEIQKPVEYIIERTIFTKGVKREILQNCDNEIFLILGKFEESSDVLSLLGEYKIFDIKDIDLENSETIPLIINIHEAITSHQLEKLQKTKKPIHILSAYESNYLEWMWSYGSRKIIEKHEVQLKYEVNQENIARLLSTAAIITDVPGMGKSVLTNYIAYHAPVYKWVLKVDLNAHQSYFREQNSSSRDCLAHLRYFYETVCSNSDRNSELSRLVFENFVSLKKIAILLDGFDEVAAAYKDYVTNMAKSLYAEGFQVLITTRPVMKQHLEETFKKSSISIMPFSVEHQKEYLTNFYTPACCDLNVSKKIQMFVEKLILLVSWNLNDLECEFMGIPLQTRLLANAFKDECEKYISSTDTTNFNNKCDLLYLYDKFIDNKINIFVEKYGEVAYEQHEEIREQQALLAIKLIFPLEQIIEADTLKQVYQPLTTKPKLIQLLQREGIMIIDDKGNITCVHRTIAEFLAAQWLSDNLQNTNEEIRKFVRDLTMERFTWNYKFLFYIFDRILSQNCPLHLAIINKQINVALNIIDSESDVVNVIDKGGRSVLHSVALNSLQYPLPFDDGFSEEDEMLSVAVKLPRDKIIMKRDVLGYTPLDYALASCSLPIANELCRNTKAHFVNIYIELQNKRDYLIYCQRAYNTLTQILVPYFASRALLQNSVKKHTKLVTFYSSNEFKVTEYQNKNIIQILRSKYGRSYSGYIKKKFRSYYSELRHAIACGSTSNVKKLLQHKGIELNKTDIDNNTPLHYAVLHGRSKIVKLLLENNAKVNKQNKDLNTPLHLSLLNCNIKIAKMLLSKKVNLDSVNIKGETVLHLAFSNNGNKIQDKKLFERYSTIVQLISSECANINSENNAGETPLHYSVKNGYSKDIISYLLLRKADVNKMSNNVQTPLNFALMEGNHEIVQFLVANGANVNAQFTGGNTPLLCAAERGDDEMVKCLVDNKADVNAQNEDGYTPLIWAVIKGRDEIVEFLVANGANVNAQLTGGDTPLLCAAERGRARDEIVKFLVENRADVNAQNEDGYTPLIWAIGNGRYEVLKILVEKGANVNAQDIHGVTPLLWAAERGRDELVKFLVENRADVNAQNGDGYTPLIWAIINGSEEILNFLVANGANINAQDEDDDTPLICAVAMGHEEIVKFLVANGANVNAQDTDGYTPLIWASIKGHDKIVKFLIENGTDVNAQNTRGNTPLIWAAGEGHNKTVKYLLAGGANVNAQEAGGYTPLILATIKGHDEIAKLLVEKGADVNAQNTDGGTSLILATIKGHDEIAKFLVANGANVDAQGKGNIPLLCAIEMGRDEIVKLLIENGADVNARNTDGDTLLILAVKDDRDHIVKFLVANRANVNAQGNGGYTPLTWAVIKCHDEIVKYLVANGANVDTLDGDGDTPLIRAMRIRHNKIIKLLRENGAKEKNLSLSNLHSQF